MSKPTSRQEQTEKLAETNSDGSVKRVLPAIRNGVDLLTNPSIKTPPELVEGILHQSCKLILGASSKARKTWILLHLGLAVSTGGLFWKWRAVKGRVLYINFEIPEAFLRSRIAKLCEVLEITDAGNLDTWTLRGHAAALKELLPDLLAQIKDRGYVLIIVDPIYKGLGGRDENAAGDIAELCNEMERLAVETGAAVAYAAHYSKGNQASKESMDRIGGSGVFARDADSIVTLTKHKEEDALSVDLVLRNHPEQQPFVVRWEYPLMVVDEELNPNDLKQAGGKQQKPVPSTEDFIKIFDRSESNPRKCLLTAVELRQAFKDRGWDGAASAACRDKAEAEGKIKVYHGGHNQKLCGLPAMVTAFERSKNGKAKK